MMKCPPPVDQLEGDYSYNEVVKRATVPHKGRTFVRPFLGADRALRPCYSEHASIPIVEARAEQCGKVIFVK